MEDKELMMQLDEEEREILESYERGEWESVPNWREELLPLYQEAARAKLEELGLVKIDLSSEDYAVIKKRAEDAGLPYQKFISNVLHRFVTGELVNR